MRDGASGHARAHLRAAPARALLREPRLSHGLGNLRRGRHSPRRDAALMPDFPVAFYPVAIVAIILTGIAKGGFGSGSGGIAVPLMAIFISPLEAAGIMLPILCAMDLFSVHAYRGRWSRAHLAILLPGALVGIALGAIAFGALPVNGVR